MDSNMAEWYCRAHKRNSKQMHARMQSCWSMASNMTEWNNRSHKSNSTDYTVNEADDLVMER